MTRADYLIGVVIVVAVAILAFVLCMTPSEKPQPIGTQTIEVESGDTLWWLADEYCPNSIDKREWIYEVMKLNNIDVLYPGTIEVFIYEQ